MRVIISPDEEPFTGTCVATSQRIFHRLRNLAEPIILSLHQRFGDLSKFSKRDGDLMKIFEENFRAAAFAHGEEKDLPPEARMKIVAKTLDDLDL